MLETGFPNVGNTCYLNSSLIVLLCIDQLEKLISGEENETSSPLCNKTKEMLCNDLSMRLYVQALEKLLGTSLFKQKDSTVSTFSCLFQLVIKLFKDFIKLFLKKLQSETSNSLSFMDAELEFCELCTSCGEIDRGASPLLTQIIQVATSQPFRNVMKDFFLSEVECSGCGHGMFQTRREFTGESPPQWMIFSFGYVDGRTSVQLSEDNLLISLPFRNSTPVNYKVKAMTIRTGSTLNYGHYVSAVFKDDSVSVYDDYLVENYQNFGRFIRKYSLWQVKDILVKINKSLDEVKPSKSISSRRRIKAIKKSSRNNNRQQKKSNQQVHHEYHVETIQVNNNDREWGQFNDSDIGSTNTPHDRFKVLVYTCLFICHAIKKILKMFKKCFSDFSDIIITTQDV